MVNKSLVIGALIILIAAASILITLNGSNVQMKIEKSDSIFSVLINNQWVTSGIEHNYLYAGTKRLGAPSSALITIKYFNDSDNFTIIRTSPYSNGAKIIDTYSYSGTAGKESFPVYHQVEIINGSGLTYQYSVSNLAYSGPTILNVQSPQSFGNSMKVYWQYGNYYSKITNSKNVGVLDVKYNLTSNDQIYSVRLFDPISPSDYNVTLISPTNASTAYNNVTFLANAQSNSSLFIQNATLYVWNESQYAMYTNTTGLVAYYPFDDNTAKDYFGVNNGTNVNGAYENALGKIGGGASFDGVNGYISNNAQINTTNNQPFTLCLWLKGEQNSSLNTMLIHGYASDTNNRLRLQYTGTNFTQISIYNNSGGSTTTLTSTSLIAKNSWGFVCAGYNGTNMTLSNNGETIKYGATELANTNSLLSMHIGRMSGSTASYNGSIDEVRIFNRTLSQAEITNFYNIEVIQYNNTVTPSHNVNFSFTNSNLTDGLRHWKVWSYGNTSTYGAWANIYQVLIDTITPNLTINFPTVSGNTYNHQINVTYSVSDTNLQACSWNDNNGANQSITCGVNITQQNWTEGSHNITIFANDSAGNLASKSVQFTMNTRFYKIQVYGGNLMFLNCSPDFENPLSLPYQQTSGLSAILVNLTETMNISARINQTAATGWTIFASNQSSLISPITLSTSFQNLYTKVTGLQSVWLYANCSFINSNPRTFIELQGAN